MTEYASCEFLKIEVGSKYVSATPPYTIKSELGHYCPVKITGQQ